MKFSFFVDQKTTFIFISIRPHTCACADATGGVFVWCDFEENANYLLIRHSSYWMSRTCSNENVFSSTISIWWFRQNDSRRSSDMSRVRSWVWLVPTISVMVATTKPITWFFFWIKIFIIFSWLTSLPADVSPATETMSTASAVDTKSSQKPTTSKFSTTIICSFLWCFDDVTVIIFRWNTFAYTYSHTYRHTSSHSQTQNKININVFPTNLPS